MLLFDLTVEVTVGAVYALGVREQLEASKDSPFSNKAFRNGAVYSALLYLPSAMFFLYSWPAWNSMYLLDLETNRRIGSSFVYLDGAALFLCYCGGFYLAAKWLRESQGKAQAVLWRLGGIWLPVSVLLLAMWGRSSAVTSYADFYTKQWPLFDFRWGQADSLWGGPLMYWLIFWCIVDFVPLGLIYLRMRRIPKSPGSLVPEPSSAAA